MSKICKTCNEEKPLDLFSKEKRNADGHTGQCRKCLSIYIKNYYLNNKGNIKKKSSTYYAKNKEKINESNNLRYQKNKTRYTEIQKKWRENNPEKVEGYRKTSNINRLGKYKDIQKLWVINNSEAVKEYRKTLKKFNSENLTDSYVRGILQKRTQMSGVDLPQELVEVKRVQILINRELNRGKICH